MQAYQSDQTDRITTSLDRHNLALLQKRFIEVNDDRLQRTRLALNARQEIFLNALPLLFHYNHPMLPGFVSHSTPCGVSNYRPEKKDIDIAKGLARSFCNTGGHIGDDVWGIYLMGSVGTLAQSQQSDFDVWLCYKPGLSQSGLVELKQKCERISAWAESLHLEAHFFLMDCHAFVAGDSLSLDEESSGSAQRVLLLDEFYRTALYIAGRLPIWWFVPAEQENSYDSLSQELLQKRLIRPETTLDFGSMNQVIDGEFIGASVWQLYKAIDSPYKSVLKLMLMEAYVNDFPNIAPLSLDYKDKIYQGSLQINDLDPYVMVYRRIESYLKDKNDQDRLELVRRCLYFKINKPLSATANSRNKSWQIQLLESLTREWGWEEDYIELLDKRPQWKTLQVREERNQLVRALNHSYEMLMNFAQRCGSARSISSMELTVLGRKLQAAFERRPGKLDWINPGISMDMSEASLELVEIAQLNESGEETGHVAWQIFGSETGRETPLRQAKSPVELLLWCYINKIVDVTTRLDISRAPSTSDNQLKRALLRLQQWLPLPLQEVDHSTYERNASPTHVLLLINVANETSSQFGSEAHCLSDNSDPFEYGALGDNLVTSVDMITRSSWHELTCYRFTGREAILDALKEYLSLCMPASHQPPPLLELECLGAHHAKAITQRCRQWFNEICACYYTGTKPPATRFIFSMDSRYYSLQFKGAKLTVNSHGDLTQLHQYLGESQRRYSPIVVDSRAGADQALKLIARQSSARALQIFFQRKPSALAIYVVDEKGSLTSFNAELTPKLDALNNLHGFLRNTLKKIKEENKLSSDCLLPSSCGVHSIEFYEIIEDVEQRLSAATRIITPDLPPSISLPLKARVGNGDDGKFEYSFYCHDRTFEWEQFHAGVFAAAAQYVLDHRQAREHYPVFITELNLDDCKDQLNSARNLQSSHYLRIKVKLEKKLRAAMFHLR